MSAIGVSLTQLITSAAFAVSRTKGVENINDLLNEVTDYMVAANMAFYDLDKIKSSLKQSSAIQNLVKSVLDSMSGLSPAEYAASMCNSILSTFSKMSAQEGKLLSTVFYRAAPFSQDSDSTFSAVPGHSVLVYHADNLLISDDAPFFLIEATYTEMAGDFLNKFIELNREPVLGDGHFGVLPYTISAATFEKSRAVSGQKLDWLTAFNQLSESIVAYWKDYNTPVNPDDRTDDEVATLQAVSSAHVVAISGQLINTMQTLIIDFTNFAES